MFVVVGTRSPSPLSYHDTLREAYIDAHHRRRKRNPDITWYKVCEYDPATDTVGAMVIQLSVWGARGADGENYDLAPLLGVHVRVAPSYHKVCIRCGTERPLNEFIPRRARICVFCQR